MVILAGQAASTARIAVAPPNGVAISEVLTFLAATGSMLVFLVGFAAVRLHAHIDHIVERHEILVDRTVETALDHGSFPWPHELQDQEAEIFKDATKDAAATMTLVFCVVVAAVGVVAAATWTGISGLLPGIAAPGTDDRAEWGVWLLTGLQVFVLGLLVFDRSEVRRIIRKERSRAVGSQYNDAAALLNASEWEEAGKKFRALQNKMPRWPWALLGTGLALYGRRTKGDKKHPDNALEEQLGLTIREEVQDVRESKTIDPKHPIDRALLQASNLLAMARVDGDEIEMLSRYKEDYPDLDQVLRWIERFTKQSTEVPRT
jgi:hypothetical protein